MARNAEDVGRQSPGTPSGGNPEGSDLRSVAKDIEGLLDDDGHFNPDPDTVSRGHPDYDESSDPRAKAPDRDERGRFKAAAAEEEGDDTAPIQEDETLDIPAAGDDSTEDTEPQAGDTDEGLAASASDDAPTDDAETGDEIQTLSEFAHALEMTVDDFKEGVTHTFNAAGEEVTVTLAELEQGYQKDADYRRSTAKLAQDRQALELENSNRMQAYEQQNHVLAATLGHAEQILSAELQDPRLAQLRQSDPAEWTARRDEIGNKLAALRDFRNQAAVAYEQFTNTNRAQLRDSEEKNLLAAIPDFGQQHKAAARKVMSGLGYSDAEIGEIYDHRLVVAAVKFGEMERELNELRALKQQGDNAVKRVKKDVPKLQKPGKGQQRTRKTLKRDNVAKLKSKARKSGSVQDAAAVIEQMI